MTKLLGGLILLIVAVLGACSRNQQPTSHQAAIAKDQSSRQNHERSHLDQYAVKGRVPAHYAAAPGPRMLQPTLAPELFTGNTRLAYQAAKDIPEVLAQLPCYCHCDRSQNHKSLHSCFESEHGENCGICIGEALTAYNLHKQGVSASEIRKQIVGAYGQSH